MKLKFTLKPLAIALLASSMISLPVLANTTNNINEAVTIAPGKQITPRDEAVISSAASKVLRHIAKARGQLQGDTPDTQQAKAELEQSEKLLDIIKSSLPTTQVKDRIWTTKKQLEYENSREVSPDLIPIYASLDELVDYTPTNQANAHPDQSKQTREQGQKSAGDERVQALDDALLYMEADLPLSATRHLVSQARADLDKGDSKSADQALMAAENNVVFVSVSIESPITHAKAALYRAREDYAQGEKTFAQADLEKAVSYLERAAKSDDPIARQAAEELVSQVRDIHQMAMSDQDIGARLDNSWQRVKALSERSAESISTGWQRLRAAGDGKKDLIEAKLQLAYARIDHLNAKDDDAAKIEMAAARGYLDAAVKQAPEGIKAKVEKVSEQITQLDNTLQTQPDEAKMVGFQQAESQLQALIRTL